MSRYAIIVNSGSGFADLETKVGAIKQAFESQSIHPEIFLAHDGEAILSTAEKAVADGFEYVIAAGGDGTVNAVASKLLNSPAILGVLPMGTLNHLARDLGIPNDLGKATELIVANKQQYIDVGQVNDRFFLNNSSIGLYPRLVRYREEQQKLGLKKWTAFTQALFNALYRYHFLKITMEIKGMQKSYRCPFVFIGNNEYLVEGFKLGARQRLDDGKLYAYINRRTDRWGLLVLAWHALTKKLGTGNDFDIVETDRLSISNHKQFLKVAIDGEIVVCSTPLEYAILPRALKVIVLGEKKA